MPILGLIGDVNDDHRSGIRRGGFVIPFLPTWGLIGEEKEPPESDLPVAPSP